MLQNFDDEIDNDEGTFLRREYSVEDDELCFSSSCRDLEVGNDDHNKQYLDKHIDFCDNLVSKIEGNTPMKPKF